MDELIDRYLGRAVFLVVFVIGIYGIASNTFFQ